jgi:hypothetical protein
VRSLCCLIGLVLLSGCAMPAAFTVASFALDAGSYAMSGKTLTDQGLSLAMEEDCAMVRLLDEDGICQEQPDYEVAEALLTPLGDDEVGFAERGESGNGSGYAELAQRVHRARIASATYLAAGMMVAEI